MSARRASASAKLISVKALADAKRRVCLPMITRRAQAFGRSTVAKWRRALLVALMLAIGFAPVAKAACDFEALAAQLGGTATALESGFNAPLPHDDDGTCCDHEPRAVVVPAKLPIADATLVLSLAGASVAPAAIGFTTGTAVLGPVRLRATAAPPEPVFRRVPRLLI